MAGARRCATCGRLLQADYRFCPDDGRALVDEASHHEALVGRTIADRYQLVELVGGGAAGEVFRARDLPSGKDVAIKVLHPGLSEDPVIVERFRRESRVARRIRSPHVVVVHEMGVSYEGLLYFVMDYVRGKTLRQELERGPLPSIEAVRIAADIASALAAAHEVGVVHRDLKPENVIVTPSSLVRVLDFSIAALVDPTSGERRSKLTRPGTLLGTPTYMCPEAIKRGGIGPAGDLYALGVMLFEMLTGGPPFVAESALGVMGMHLRVPPPDLEQARPGIVVPRPLRELVGALLAKDPAARPPSALVVRARLDELQDMMSPTEVLSARETASAEPAPPPTRRSAWLGPGLALLAAAAIIVLTLMRFGSCG